MRKVVQVLTVIFILVNVVRVDEAVVEEKVEAGSGVPAGSAVDEAEEAEEELALPDEAETESQGDAVALDQLELHLLSQKLKMLEQRAQLLRDSVMQEAGYSSEQLACRI